MSFDERNDRFDHALDVLDAVWRGDGVEITEGDGRTSVVLPDPPPFQQPIPIWIGGNAGRTVSESPNGRRGGCRCQIRLRS